MNKEPNRRYGDAAEMAADFVKLVGELLLATHCRSRPCPARDDDHYGAPGCKQHTRTLDNLIPLQVAAQFEETFGLPHSHHRVNQRLHRRVDGDTAGCERIIFRGET